MLRDSEGSDKPPLAATAEAIRVGEPTRNLVSALRKLTLERLAERLARMFDSADDLLFEMTSRADSEQGQRGVLDAMRQIRLERDTISAAFGEALAGGFAGQAARAAPTAPRLITSDEMSLTDSRAIEETIAICNMETKADDLYRNLLWEIGRRLDWLIEARAAPMARDALAPTVICRAFQKAAGSLEVAADVHLVIYKLFDRFVISTLAPFYEEALSLLVVSRVQPAVRSAPGQRAGRNARLGASRSERSEPSWRAPAVETGPAITAPITDPRTAALLRQLTSTLAPAATQPVYGDADLAGDLAAAVQGHPVHGWADQQARAYVQRTDLVTRMFGDLLDDIDLPESTLLHMNLLRFAAIKSALKDPAFFANTEHPVRRLVNELATLAAVARASGSDAVQRLTELIAEIRGQFEVNAANLRAPAGGVEPIDSRLVEKFVGEQQEQHRARRKAIVTKVREIVAAELKLRTIGRPLPKAVQPLLLSGWSVVMARHLTQHGAGSEAWNTGLAQLERVLEAVDPGDKPSPPGSEIAALAEELRTALLEAGVAEERTEAMLTGFREVAAGGVQRHLSLVVSRGEPEPDENGQSAPAPLDVSETLILDLLLVPGRWFHIFDRSRNERRWLKFIARREFGASEVMFTEFNGKNPLTLALEHLMDDLVAHRSEPIDAPPACRQALDTLIARRKLVA